MKRILSLLLLATLPVLAEGPDATGKGAAWLLTQQQPDGSFASSPKGAGDVGITALAVTALAKSGQAKAPQVEKAVAFLLKNAHPDGSIWNDDGVGLYNYRTSISLMALHAVDPEKYKDAIQKAQAFLVGIQKSEANGNAKKGDVEEGGIGYGDDGPKNDLSNTAMALQALKESGYTNEEVFQRAAEFAARCQNHPSNPINKEPGRKTGAGSDGSFFYGPRDNDPDVLDKGGLEKAPESGTEKGERDHPKGYGSMTYAGLLTMVYARLGKDDPRVSAAWGWIQKHYTLQDNPGLASVEKPLAGKQGLYYYYLTFAKAMKAYGETHVQTADGVKHRWSEELKDILVKGQKPEGFWTNENSQRWMEGNPVLATSFALLALQICQEDLGAGH